jgi:benzoyl-CoA-dihydrodiol lyase
VHQRAAALAASTGRPAAATGIELPPLDRTVDGDTTTYPHLTVTIDRAHAAAHLTLAGPTGPQEIDAGADFWPLATCRALEDAILRLRFNEPGVGTWVLKTTGDPAAVLAVDEVLRTNNEDWRVREIVGYWRRTLKRLDVSARTLVALVEPGSCFAGTLAELVVAADRSFMLDDPDGEATGPVLVLTDVNTGWYRMANGLTRLQTRFYGHPDGERVVAAALGEEQPAKAASDLGLVTFTPDDLDWDDEVRLFLEERASFSPDALTGMEANCRFVGPETMETKIFGRLSAWQNWIFQRPNAAGPEGALRRYGSGSRPAYDRERT